MPTPALPNYINPNGIPYFSDMSPYKAASILSKAARAHIRGGGKSKGRSKSAKTTGKGGKK